LEFAVEATRGGYGQVFPYLLLEIFLMKGALRRAKKNGLLLRPSE
jgi:hypothetical protein